MGDGRFILFCEGTAQSLDVLVLRQVVYDLATVEVRPAQGKDGLPGFARGFAAARSDSAGYLVCRDRDFDCQPTSDSRILPDPYGREQVVLSHRASVESYLLDPSLVHEALQANNRPSPGYAQLAATLAQAAATISDYQAVRWAPATLWPADLPTARLHALTAADGKLPADLSLSTSRDAALARLRPLTQAAGRLSAAALDESIAHWRARFGSVGFLDGDQWRVWFHGKDLRTAWARLQPAVPWKRCLTWAAEQLDWRQHPDLVQLHELIRDRAS